MATWTALLSTWLNKAISVARLNAFFSSSGNMQWLYDRVTEDIGAQAYHDANQNVNNSEITALALNSETWDTDTMHDPATNNSRLTVVTAGKYLVTGQVAFASNATGLRVISIRLGGTTHLISCTDVPVTASPMFVNVAVICNLSAGNYVELTAYQTSGGVLAVEYHASRSPVLTAQLLARTA
jgi:hypothetical protein